ncbi:MAG: hypothetical protein LBK06_02010 [Planctomycetaceae bacterium]|nr:hypothetical protein [Planctomycetaceae bacterium]
MFGLYGAKNYRFIFSLPTLHPYGTRTIYYIIFYQHVVPNGTEIRCFTFCPFFYFNTYAKAVLKFAKLNTVAQQREAVTRGRSLLPYRLRYNILNLRCFCNNFFVFSVINTL